MPPKTTTQRVQDLHKRREAEGLKQIRGLWAYPEDHSAIKQAAAKVTAKTARARKREKEQDK